MDQGKRRQGGYWAGYCWCIVVILLSFGCDVQPAPEPAEQQEPLGTVCDQYIELFIDSENPSRFLAQAEQESACNPFAESPVGAIGLMQFMPSTAKTAENSFCRHLGKARPENPIWSAKCAQSYMEYFTVDLFDNYCDNKYVDEQRYNGGYWVIWELLDAMLRDGFLSFSGARDVCGTTLSNGKRRAFASCRENYEYPERISLRQEQYLQLGGQYCVKKQ